ncbi:MAG TPA: histidine kinase [Solirubrobacteraceae bacterium]|nr:histidine kinase [Solirubrobacteraceae bacterium]
MTALAHDHAPLPRWQRMRLPGELRGGVDGRRSARDWVVDLAMYGVAAGLSALVLTSTWADHSGLAFLIDFVLGAIAFVALWFRRSHPLAVGLVAGVASLFSGAAGGPALIALFNVAMRGSRQAILAIVGLALASTVIFPLLYAGDGDYVLQLVLGVLVTGVVVGWGLFVRVQRELVLSLRERAEGVEAEQRQRVEQAREAERLRIAREMHDVLAHRVSLLSLHATISAETGAAPVVAVVSRRAVGVAASSALALPGAGTGLVGLAERVALAGGELEHGATAPATSSCARRCRGRHERRGARPARRRRRARALRAADDAGRRGADRGRRRDR